VAANQNLIDAYDRDTGRPLWRFDTVTYPVLDPATDNGANVWGGMALDPSRGIVFVAAGDPHPNFLGMSRGGDDKYANSVIALDVLSGKLLWSFQGIFHDLWDLDVPAAPNLVTVKHNGRRVDAVAQVTKQGNTLLLDRLTGKPLFPFRMRRAPVSPMPGEGTAPYQPAPEIPEPFSRQEFTRDDATTISPEAHAAALRAIDASHHGWFAPVVIDKPTIYYGIHGGAEWPGAAFDPTTGLLYVSANEIPWIIQLAKLDDAALRAMVDQASPGAKVFKVSCAVCHGDHRQGQGMAPPLIGLKTRLNEDQVGHILKNGRNAMPPFASILTDEQSKSVIDFLLDKDDAHLTQEYSRGSPMTRRKALHFQRIQQIPGC